MFSGKRNCYFQNFLNVTNYDSYVYYIYEMVLKMKEALPML